jgi:uncharacterized membrane protein
VKTASATAPGTYTLTITGTDSANKLSHTATVALVVPSPDFSLAASPAARTVSAGQSTSYAATVTPLYGYTGTVGLSASGLPSGTTATFVPTSITTSGSSTMNVQTSSSTAAGTYTVTITGTDSGNKKLSHQTTVSLVVQRPDFAVSASPSSQTINQGDSTTYAVGIQRISGYSGSVAMSVSGLPSGASSSFSPTTVPPTGSSSTLQVTTTSTTNTGTFTLTITGTDSANNKLSHTTTVSLVVQPVNFRLSGNLSSSLNLGGGGQPLDLQIQNPYNRPLTVSAITVTVTATSKQSGGCGTDQFGVTPLPSSFSVVVPANTTESLSQLQTGPTPQFPYVKWIDEPYPQNMCLGATLSFSYQATGHR